MRFCVECNDLELVMDVNLTLLMLVPSEKANKGDYDYWLGSLKFIKIAKPVKTWLFRQLSHFLHKAFILDAFEINMPNIWTVIFYYQAVPVYESCMILVNLCCEKLWVHTLLEVLLVFSFPPSIAQQYLFHRQSQSSPCRSFPNMNTWRKCVPHR